MNTTTSHNAEAQLLIARLLTVRALPRTDTAVKRVLVDDAFREAIDRQLSACGLRWLDNPYSQYVAIGLDDKLQHRVLGEELWAAESLQLNRDTLATLVVLWSLLILPKRQRQGRRKTAPQKELFGIQAQVVEEKPLEPESLPRETFFADFREVLGSEQKVTRNLSILTRLGFIEQRDFRLFEGPLLDLAIDYSKLAPRILEGAMKVALKVEAVEVSESPHPDNA
jgi:hypothetical protein